LRPWPRVCTKLQRGRAEEGGPAAGRQWPRGLAAALHKGGRDVPVDKALDPVYADLGKLIWNVAEQISKCSQANELFPGDIIYSGTQQNVGPVMRGNVIDRHINRLPNLGVKIG
jgi:hypothetical protein